MSYNKFSLLDSHRLRQEINADAGSEVVDRWGELDPARAAAQVNAENSDIALDKYSLLDPALAQERIDTQGFDSTAPDAPTIENSTGSTDDNTLHIYGEAEAGSTVKVYQNSVLVGTTTAAENTSWSYDTPELLDGVYAYYATATDTHGNISAHSTTKTITVDTELPTPDNPVMRLEFETLVGTTLVESINGFASVAEGTAPALFAPGIVGAKGMTFNGTDNYVSIDGTGGHFETDSFSYSTWTKNVIPTQTTRILSKNDIQGYTSFYFLDDGSDPLSIVALGYLEGAMGVTSVAALWSIVGFDMTAVRHFVWTYDHTAAQNWELYIDKVKQNAWTRANNGVGVKLAKTNNAALWIGASNDLGTPSSFFNGDRDDAWWFDRAITQEEVDMLYELETE